VIARLAEKVPVLVGAKVTFTRLELPGGSENGPVSIAENGAPAGPLTLPTSLASPRLVIFNFALA